MFELHNIKAGDRKTLARAEAYLHEHPDEGVRLRPDEQLQRAMETGQGAYFVEDDEICGLSLVYKFEIPPTGPIFSEIGTMRITANGFDLQALVAKLQLMQVYLEEYSAGFPRIFAVVTPGTASEYILTTKVGMGRWTPPPELRVLREGSGVPFVPEKYAILAERQSIVDAFRDLRALHRRDNVFATPKGGAEVAVQMKWFYPALLDHDP